MAGCLNRLYRGDFGWQVMQPESDYKLKNKVKLMVLFFNCRLCSPSQIVKRIWLYYAYAVNVFKASVNIQEHVCLKQIYTTLIYLYSRGYELIAPRQNWHLLLSSYTDFPCLSTSVPHIQNLLSAVFVSRNHCQLLSTTYLACQ